MFIHRWLDQSRHKRIDKKKKNHDNGFVYEYAYVYIEEPMLPLPKEITKEKEERGSYIIDIYGE